jgi:hypothetical protein
MPQRSIAATDRLNADAACAVLLALCALLCGNALQLVAAGFAPIVAALVRALSGRTFGLPPALMRDADAITAVGALIAFELLLIGVALVCRRIARRADVRV